MPLLDVSTVRRRLVVCGAILAAAALSAGGAVGARHRGAVVPGKNGVIAFQSFRDGTAQIYFETVPPSPVYRVTQRTLKKGTHCYAVPAWSPDASMIVYEYNKSPIGKPASNSDVWLMDSKGGHQRALTNARAFDGDPTWSPDGTQIAFESTRSGNPDIWVMNNNGSNPRNLTPGNLGVDRDPAWSPGGHRIAYTGAAKGQLKTDIYLLDAENPKAPPLNLTNTPSSDDFDPAWSPDGQLVAFVSNRDGNDEIYETNDRFLLTRLTNNAGTDAFPAWSPDGKLIAFSTDRGDAGNRDLFTMSSNGDAGGVTELTQAPGWDQAPDWQTVSPARMRIPTPKLPPPAVPKKAWPDDAKPAAACVAK